MDAIYTFLVLALLTVSGQAGKIVKDQPSPRLENNLGKWGDIGLSADVNAYVDNTIAMIVPFIQQHGLDPMSLPEINEKFLVKPVLITYSAELKLHDGYMTGLVNVQRSGDQMVHYFAQMLRVRVQLQFTDLEFAFKYLIKVMNIGPTGTIYGSLSRFVVISDILLDFNNDEIHLQEFALRDIGQLRVRLGGNVLVDWLVNPFISIFTSIFNTTIMGIVETNIRSAMYSALDVINVAIKEILANIEAQNRNLF